MHIPTDEEIRAAAERDGLIAAGADLPARLRKSVAAKLLEDQQRAARQADRPTGTQSTLLSRFRYEVPGGAIVVDVVFIPQPQKD